MNSEIKNIDRKLRILRLYLFCKSFFIYNHMELHRKAIMEKNDWNKAERKRDSFRCLFPDRNIKVEEFLYDKNELSDKVIDYYNDFTKCLTLGELLGIQKRTVEAFCKNVYHTSSCYHLKGLGCLHYPLWINAIFRYLDNTLSKENLIFNFVEYSIYDREVFPARFSLFRNSIIIIEKLVNEITTKQATRYRRSAGEFVE